MELDTLRCLEEVFEKMTEIQMREYGLEAIRRQQGMDVHPTRTSITLRNWYPSLLDVLFPEVPQESAAPGQLTRKKLQDFSRSPASDRVIYSHHVHVRRFWHWMESAGFALAFKHYHDQRGGDTFDQWVLTDIGAERLKADHPLAPGAMQRLSRSFGADLADSLARLEDAHTCFDHGLWRPAIALLGLAYEELLITTAQRLKVGPKANAKDRHEALRKAIEQHKNSEPKTAALNALNVANAIREARNDAVHKAASSWTALEVDELLADGMRSYSKIACYTPTL
jgi:hypothetical protein